MCGCGCWDWEPDDDETMDEYVERQQAEFARRSEAAVRGWVTRRKHMAERQETIPIELPVKVPVLA